MFKEIGLAIRALFSALTTLFGAFNKGASAVDHLAEWANETAGAFSDEARQERLVRQADAAKLLAVAQKAEKTPKVQAITG